MRILVALCAATQAMIRLSEAVTRIKPIILDPSDGLIFDLGSLVEDYEIEIIADSLVDTFSQLAIESPTFKERINY